jgi:hypothetical protein
MARQHAAVLVVEVVVLSWFWNDVRRITILGVHVLVAAFGFMFVVLEMNCSLESASLVNQFWSSVHFRTEAFPIRSKANNIPALMKK